MMDPNDRTLVDRNSETLVEILERGLLDQAKQELIDHIVKEHLEIAERDLRDNLKEMLEDLTLGKINAWREMIEMRDKLAIEFHWTGGEDSP